MSKVDRLNEIRARLQVIGCDDDPDDPHIDPGILETLVILNALGFNTCMSCEGHVWSEQSDPTDIGPNYGPYVEIGAFSDGKFNFEDDSDDEPPEFSEERLLDPTTEDIARSVQQAQEISEMQTRLIGLLTEFYSSYVPSEMQRLVVSRPDQDFYGFTLASQGAWIVRPCEEHKNFLREAQTWMALFTGFLTDKYFKS